MAVSDVSLGFGSPQIAAFLRSLQHFYGPAAEVILFEPDEPQKPSRQSFFPTVDIRRVSTAFHPHTGIGRVEYLTQVAPVVNRLHPDVLVLFCTYTLPVLFHLHSRPPFVIFYALESAALYGKFDIQMNRSIGSLVDLIIYPEENRAARDIAISGYRAIPFVTIYNCSDSHQSRTPLSPRDRNGRVLYQGTIDFERTHGSYYLNPKLQDLPIDLFGPITGSDGSDLEARLGSLSGQVRYRGFIDAATLSAFRPNYLFSIVIWNPINENTLYACPNKFFESIADGVPPITAPHPQCDELVRRYGCGIVMADWTFESFLQAIEDGLRMRGSDLYEEMVSNCQRATMQELNWNAQFDRIKPFLRR